MPSLLAVGAVPIVVGLGGGSSLQLSPTLFAVAQAIALGFGRTYGLAMVLAGLMGGFMLML